MPGKLEGKKVAALSTDGVEQVEFTKPRDALLEAGATVERALDQAPTRSRASTISTRATRSRSTDRSRRRSVDDYDALLLPGGVANPDFLRADKDAVAFVHDFFAQGKPVGCDLPRPLDARRGRRRPGPHPDVLAIARRQICGTPGPNWVDQEVVVDQGLVTSRKPDDMPAFYSKMVEEIAEGAHAGQHA